MSAVPGGGYGMASGTSFSAPMVAGMAALIRSLRYNDTASTIAQSTVRIDGRNPKYYGQLGYGRVDLRRAVAERQEGEMSTVIDRVDNSFRVAELEDRAAQQTLAMATSLISLIDLRDRYTGGHSSRVAAYCRRIAVQMGLPHEETEADRPRRVNARYRQDRCSRQRAAEARQPYRRRIRMDSEASRIRLVRCPERGQLPACQSPRPSPSRTVGRRGLSRKSARQRYSPRIQDHRRGRFLRCTDDKSSLSQGSNTRRSYSRDLPTHRHTVQSGSRSGFLRFHGLIAEAPSSAWPERVLHGVPEVRWREDARLIVSVHEAGS